ncbi:hypothetical protein [Streptomyces sp. FIT100]|uniref:hypothetical protein n=1 Tax=Streptomyces sp. FIT100 TaxID=2837956 RepID=UPI0037D9BAB4
MALAVAACRAGYSIYFTSFRRHGPQPHSSRSRGAFGQQARHLPPPERSGCG